MGKNDSKAFCQFVEQPVLMKKSARESEGSCQAGGYVRWAAGESRWGDGVCVCPFCRFNFPFTQQKRQCHRAKLILTYLKSTI